jgi:hypothetical protein
MTRAVLLAVLVASTAACSGGGSGPVASSAAPSATGSSSGSSGVPSGEVVSGSAYRIRIPTAPAYLLDQDEVRADDGAHLRRWRHAVTATGPFCVVIATEQPHFTGDFPGASIALLQAEKGPKDTIVKNAVVTPAPSGVLGAVDQEETFVSTLDDGSTVNARLFGRDVLTPGRTLVSVTASGPDDGGQACASKAIVASLELTGAEAPTDPATPSPIPSDVAARLTSPSAS